MSEDQENDTKEPAANDAAGEPSQQRTEENPTADGPKFTTAPDPLAGVKKGAADVMASMDGKTYVGTIIAVVVLMMLARCGG